jgi:hypothetical protein
MEETDMRRVIVGNGLCMITEIREGTRGGPGGSRRRGFVALFLAFSSPACSTSGCRANASARVPGFLRLEEKRTLQKEQEVLRLEALALKSPARIHAIAGTTCTWSRADGPGDPVK